MPADPRPSGIVALAGGVGGAKLAAGLQALVGAGLTVVVNTADDFELHGLTIWPDHDTVAYTLASLDDREQGWGLRDETWHVMAALDRLGGETWFRLGDHDLATHLLRSSRLGRGDRATEVAFALQAALGVGPRILPMSDEPVRTEVRTDDGWLPFQDYFVRLRQAPTVHEIRFRGIDNARPSGEVRAAIQAAEAIVVCPSNPFVSIGPILALPGIREAIAARRAAGVRVVAVSPIVAGRALKGPADRMLRSLGHDPSALGVARLYAGIADVLVVDDADAGLAPAIRSAGIEPLVAETVMTDDASRTRLAATVVDASRSAGVSRAGARA
jgi:LPPG:FO 2-phospho-L-lactate transferase